MAKYEVTFSCGHTVEVQLFGKEADRQRKIKWYEEQGLCPDCYKALREKEKKEEAEKAATEAKNLGLAELQGSEKQIAWANSIRTSQIKNINKLMSDLQRGIDRIRKTGENVEYLDAGNNMMLFWHAVERVIGSETNVSKIIDNRNTWFEAAGRKYLQDADKLKSGVEKPESFKDFGSFVVDAIKEIYCDDEHVEETAVLVPEEKKSDVAVTVSYTDKEVSVTSEKDQKIIGIVKGAGYRWNRDKMAWELKIDATTGSPEDRASDIANKLLINGYQVIVPKEIEKKSASGDFDPRFTRWIINMEGDSENVYIKWCTGEFYSQAKLLSGAKWSRIGMRVPVTSADEIEEFAGTYGFHISPGAKENIEAYRKKVTIVSPMKGAAEETVDKSKDIEDVLNSSREVIEDLKDE